MSKIQLIVTADEPALFFETVEYAERYHEAIDVEDGVFGAVFGPNGERYSIRTDGRRVYINKTDEDPDPEALKNVMMRFFAEIGEPQLPEVDLPFLLKQCENRITY